MPPPPYPLGTTELFGLADRRADRVLTALVVGLLLASRLAAFPASIWEQDEAYLAAAVVSFDPTSNLPHPPWFPLWIALGRLVQALGADSTTALRLASCAFSVWMLFPLTALWSVVMSRRLAVAAAVLVLVAPGPWWLAGRAFSGTAATAVLVAAFAFWLQAADRTRWLTAGSLAAALAVLIRPQLLPAAIGALAMIAIRTSPANRWRLTGFFALPLIATTVILAAIAGGPAPLCNALVGHAGTHFPRLDEAAHGFARSGFVRSLGHPVAAVVWLLLMHVGFIRLARQGRWRAISPVLIGAALPLLAVVQLLSNPNHARYAIPVLALTCGPVALGIEALARRWSWVVVGAAAAAAVGFVGPQLGAYRTTVSPPVAALETAIADAETRSGTLIVDRTLHAFVVERELRRPIDAAVLFDHMVERGWAPAPPPDSTVYLFDDGRGGILIDADNRARFTTEIPLARALAQDRYLDLVIATGARVASRRHAATDISDTRKIVSRDSGWPNDPVTHAVPAPVEIGGGRVVDEHDGSRRIGELGAETVGRASSRCRSCDDGYSALSGVGGAGPDRSAGA